MAAPARRLRVRGRGVPRRSAWCAVVVAVVAAALGIRPGDAVTASPPADLVSAGPSPTTPAPSQDRVASISSDGRFVAFTSLTQVGEFSFPLANVRDRVAETTQAVPMPLNGTQQQYASISGDGCFVAYWVLRVPPPTAIAVVPPSWSLYRWDRCTAGAAPVDLLAALPKPASYPIAATVGDVAVSFDGRFVAYTVQPGGSLPSDPPRRVAVVDTTERRERVMPNPANTRIVQALDLSDDGGVLAVAIEIETTASSSTTQVFAWRPPSGEVEQVSVTAGGQPANLISTQPTISGNGRFVAFASNSTTLLGITSQLPQVYVRDLQNDTTQLVSTVAGQPENATVVQPDLNGDGTQLVLIALSTGAPAGTTTRSVASPPAAVYAVAASPAGFAGAPWELVSFGVDGANAPGSNVNPVISGIGGVVAWTSNAGPALSGQSSFPTDDNIWARERPLNLTVTTSLDFGDVNLGTASAPQSVIVTNQGRVPAVMGPALAQPEVFVITANTCSGTTLAPGATCSVTLEFRPAAIGDVSGTLVIGVTGLTLTTGLRGRGTVSPTLVMNPGVVRPGDVSAAQGAGFPPGVPVQLARGDGEVLVTVTPDATGAFQVDLLILRNGVQVGTNGDIVAVDQPGVFTGVRAPLLVEQASFQPSGPSNVASFGGMRRLVSRNG